jgi:hypothetical protein
VKFHKECIDKILIFILESSGEITLTYTSRSASIAQGHARCAQAEEILRLFQPK